MRIDWFTFFAQIVNFIILVLLLRRFLYRPVIDAMERREQRIAERLKDAQIKDAQAQERIAEYEGKVREIEERRNELFEQARAQAQRQGIALQDRARVEVDQKRAQWYAALEQDKDRFLADLRGQVSGGVFSVSRSALRDVASVDLEVQAVNRFLEALKRPGVPGTMAGDRSVIVVRTAYDLPLEMQQRIIVALRGRVPLENGVRFETAPEIICGIELTAGGRRLRWSIGSYLDRLEEELGRRLAQGAPAPEKKEALHEGTVAAAR